eukprot:CAMPEP_0119264664 /NCGR_PEP_ID=MMETSP1329-20130426/3681_1 /TAXON_ID=114041 /ORGANISM="Genus nov. species nov., Strain RCC1024" /LENGTH=488 /DNA_ID=CAMNT_0007264449 /DNA_START=238 /DNA_END=1704 /DNA_ORIENTATION=-
MSKEDLRPSQSEENALIEIDDGVLAVHQDPRAQFRFTQKDSSKFYSGIMPVEPAEGFKAKEILLFSFDRPHMRAFHLAYMSLFAAFVCWFAIPPLMPLLKVDLGLTRSQVFATDLFSVLGTILMRFVAGPLCDKIGPRRCQFYLLTWMCGWTLVSIGVDSFAMLCVIRFCVGFGGATFVVTEYWTTRMFASNIVGTANATTAGWGNLGGAVAQLLMVGVYAGMRQSGLSRESGWRMSFIIPVLVTGSIALGVIRLTDDTPRGDLTYLYKAGVLKRRSGLSSARAGALDANSWVLGLQYACCFGVELHVQATVARYFQERDSFGVGVIDAGLIASLFGWMNLFARSLGGILSDLANARSGLRGRLAAHSACLFLEGMFMCIFASQSDRGAAIFCLMLFSFFVQASEGTTFGIVPYVSSEGLGGVCGTVGAWGNIGAVCWALLFEYVYHKNAHLGYEIIGYIVMASSMLSFLIRIKGHTHLMGDSLDASR